MMEAGSVAGKTRSAEGPGGLPAGPGAPGWWQLYQYSVRPLEVLERAAARFGAPFTIHLAGYGKLVLLTDTGAIQDVFRGDPTALHSGEGNEFLSITAGKNSVLVLDEERHARQREAIMPALRGERMRAMAQAVWTETEAALAQWPVNESFAALPWMRRITLRVILRTVFGLTEAGELDRFEGLVEGLLGAVRSQYTLILAKAVPLWLMRVPWTGFQRRLRALDGAIYGMLAERRRTAAARPPNIADDLLAYRGEGGAGLAEVEIRDALVTMSAAGYDTSAVALAWALEQILPRGDVGERIRAEADDLAPETAGAKRPYLEAAIRESLRMRSIFPFVVRLTKRPFRAGDREYPAGVILAPCGHLVHRRPDLYPNPEAFRPERFLERSFTPEEWLPFGGGDRTCAGMALALSEMKIVLAMIVGKTRLERPANAASRPIRRGLALAPDDGCQVVLRGREGARG